MKRSLYIKILVITCLLISVYCRGQQPFPYFKFNTNLFHENGKSIDEKFRFSTIVFYNDSLFFDKRSDSSQNYFIRDIDSFSICVNIHPFPLNSKTIGTIGKGGVYGLRVTEKRSKKEMRIYFRACDPIIFGTEINLVNLEFLEGIYFYDMLFSKKRFQIECKADIINLGDMNTHKTSFKKMKILITKKVN